MLRRFRVAFAWGLWSRVETLRDRTMTWAVGVISAHATQDEKLTIAHALFARPRLTPVVQVTDTSDDPTEVTRPVAATTAEGDPVFVHPGKADPNN